MLVSTVSKYIVLNILHYERNNAYDTVAHSEPSQTFEMELFVKQLTALSYAVNGIS